MNLQTLSRVAHATDSGIEIIREWFVEPYEAHTKVLKALLGYVSLEGDTWVRTPPAHDPFITNCYCREARAEYVDPAMAASLPGLLVNNDDEIADNLNRRVDFPTGIGGAKIIAHYRPMITAFQFAEVPDKYFDAQWDFIDPKYVPGVMQLPWPDGLCAAIKALGQLRSDNVPDSVASPLHVPVVDFSIRRVLVGQVPWHKIRSCTNGVNKEAWPSANHGCRGNLPTFPRRTLKFTGADVVNMIDSEGHRQYEITYRFQWLQMLSRDLYDENANRTTGWVTWNHIFYRPWWWGPQKTGWYNVFISEQREIAGIPIPDIPGAGILSDRLHKDCDFDLLFSNRKDPHA